MDLRPFEARTLTASDPNKPLTDFTRQDEANDILFYDKPRLVSHLDSRALGTVERIIGDLLTDSRPEILDLMASWDSHLTTAIDVARVAGLGLNRVELEANHRLTERVVHDLNSDPRLPWADSSFDVVLNVVSVDYLVDPVAVFTEVNRVLRPGGLFLIIFSNRWFESKVTRLWRASSEGERVILVEQWLRQAGGFGPTQSFVSKGQPRPSDDKYSDMGIPSDPVYAVYAEKQGGPSGRAPRIIRPQLATAPWPPEEVARRQTQVGITLICPHCGERLSKWAVPQTPFTEWDNEFMYICFNDGCPYMLGGWEAMGRQGNLGTSYRFMYNPDNGGCFPVPILSLIALRDGIVD